MRTQLATPTAVVVALALLALPAAAVVNPDLAIDLDDTLIDPLLWAAYDAIVGVVEASHAADPVVMEARDAGLGAAEEAGALAGSAADAALADAAANAGQLPAQADSAGQEAQRLVGDGAALVDTAAAQAPATTATASALAMGLGTHALGATTQGARDAADLLARRADAALGYEAAVLAPTPVLVQGSLDAAPRFPPPPVAYEVVLAPVTASLSSIDVAVTLVPPEEIDVTVVVDAPTPEAIVGGATLYAGDVVAYPGLLVPGTAWYLNTVSIATTALVGESAADATTTSGAMVDRLAP